MMQCEIIAFINFKFRSIYEFYKHAYIKVYLNFVFSLKYTIFFIKLCNKKSVKQFMLYKL